MNVQSFSECQTIQLNVKENLFIRSWDKSEIEVQFPEELDYDQQNNSLSISSKTDLIISAPVNTKLYIERTGGNCKINGNLDTKKIIKVSGNLNIESITNSEIIKVGGNCNIGSVEESLQIEKIGGNCHLKNVSGKIVLGKIGGNLSISGTDYHLDCKAGGNIHIQIKDFLDNENQVIAGGNVNLLLTEGTNLDIQGSSNGGYQLEIGGDRLTGKIGDFHKTIGNGDKSVIVSAGGNLKLSDQGKIESHNLEFMESDHIISDGIDSINNIEDDLDFHEISNLDKKIKNSLNNFGGKVKGKVLEKLEKLGSNEKLEDILQNNPVSLNENDNHAPVQNSQSVSEEEKMIVLKMLQEKKISAEEADRLLQALEEY